MQIREIIEYKYSSPKISSNHKKKKKEFLNLFLPNQERNIKISRTHPRLRVYK